jgi:hypothetical protein
VKSKKILAILVLLMMIASVVVAVFVTKRRQELRLRAEPATVLSLVPAQATQVEGDIFSLDIQIGTNENQVYGADLYLSFNPQVIEVLSISPGTFLTNAQELGETIIDNETGRVIYSLASLTYGQGTGILATLNLKAASEGVSTIDFVSGTSVTGEEKGELLAETYVGSYTVTAGTVVTPTPTSTPQPTATPTPTEAADTTPTPTPTAGPTGTPTPTPTAGTGTTPTPTGTPTPTSALPEAGVVTPSFFILLLGLLSLGMGGFLLTY